MLVTPEYCRLMARYNAWQNTGLRRMVAAMDPAELSADRGAFFGSIMATLNHLLWADQVGLHRLAGHPGRDCGIAQGVALTPRRRSGGQSGFAPTGGSRSGPRGCARSICWAI